MDASAIGPLLDSKLRPSARRTLDAVTTYAAQPECNTYQFTHLSVVTDRKLAHYVRQFPYSLRRELSVKGSCLSVLQAQAIVVSAVRLAAHPSQRGEGATSACAVVKQGG